MPNPTCSTCRYWDRHKPLGGELVNPYGMCRAVPPGSRGFPSTVGNVDWCGQHAEHPMTGDLSAMGGLAPLSSATVGSPGTGRLEARPRPPKLKKPA
jgi:hypothetical protein